MPYVEESILDDIDMSKEIYERRAKRERTIDNLAREALEQESSNHSNEIEHLPRRSHRRQGKALLRTSRALLENAWNWAINEYEGIIDQDFIQAVAGRINPPTRNIPQNPHHQFPQHLPFRDGILVTIRGSSFLPPRSDKIRPELSDMLGITNDDERHPVERAVVTHFHLVRIHPFEDGNGRTARLLQNLILHYEGYAPITITTAERELYFHQIRRTIAEQRDFETKGIPGLGPEEQHLYNWLASKVNEGFERLTSLLDDMPVYEVRIKKLRNPALTYALKSILTEDLRSQGTVGIVRVVNGKRGELQIVGNTDETRIRSVIDKNYSGLKYSVEDRT